MSKTIDPIIAFGNVSYNYTFEGEHSLNQPRNGLILTGGRSGGFHQWHPGDGFRPFLQCLHELQLPVYLSIQFHLYLGWKSPTLTAAADTQSMLYIGTGWRFSRQRPR